MYNMYNFFRNFSTTDAPKRFPDNNRQEHRQRRRRPRDAAAFVVTPSIEGGQHGRRPTVGRVGMTWQHFTSCSDHPHHLYPSSPHVLSFSWFGNHIPWLCHVFPMAVSATLCQSPAAWCSQRGLLPVLARRLRRYSVNFAWVCIHQNQKNEVT